MPMGTAGPEVEREVAGAVTPDARAANSQPSDGVGGLQTAASAVERLRQELDTAARFGTEVREDMVRFPRGPVGVPVEGGIPSPCAADAVATTAALGLAKREMKSAARLAKELQEDMARFSRGPVGAYVTGGVPSPCAADVSHAGQDR